MKAEELRVGNWVLVNDKIKTGDAVMTEIHSITSDGSGGYGYNSFQGGMPDFYDCEPILLTPEILEVAGFEEIGFGNGPHSIKYQKDYLIIFFDTIENAALFCYYKDENRKKGRTIKNLHDFQNFYFGLTGEELHINQL